MSTVTFVTCVYCVRKDRDLEEEKYREFLWEKFSLLMKSLPTDVKVVVFTDAPRLVDARIHYVVRNLDEFETMTRFHDRPIPAIRNETKDTLFFLGLMNTKVEMLHLAKTYTDTTHLCWIDSGIMKVFHSSVKERLERLSHLVYPDNRIVVPGCYPDAVNWTRDKVCWRFCGGVLVIPQVMTEIFYLLCKAQDQKDIKATWEVNIWAEIDYRTSCLFSWYPGDHNETILDVKV